MKTFRQFTEGEILPFAPKKKSLSSDDNKRGFFMAQKHKSVEEVMHSAKPLLNDLANRGFPIMKASGFPSKVDELKKSIHDVHKATDGHKSNYPTYGVHLNHGSDEIKQQKSRISNIKHHDHGITSFEDGYGGDSGIGLPKEFTHQHLKDHITKHIKKEG